MAPRLLPAILMACFILSSCASIPLRPLSTGETRLTRMEMPDVVREDLPYEVVLSLQAEERPMVSKICFRWVAEEVAAGSSPLYCFTDADFSKEQLCTASAAQNTAMGSELFCVGPQDIRTDVPGKLIVKIRPVKLKANYNKLECQAEYLADGRSRTTNKISTRIIVER
ncbi:MAG: hypothetical protein ABFD97_06465 [Syntrophobacter sp.]